MYLFSTLSSNKFMFPNVVSYKKQQLSVVQFIVCYCFVCLFLIFVGTYQVYIFMYMYSVLIILISIICYTFMFFYVIFSPIHFWQTKFLHPLFRLFKISLKVHIKTKTNHMIVIQCIFYLIKCYKILKNCFIPFPHILLHSTKHHKNIHLKKQEAKQKKQS